MIMKEEVDYLEEEKDGKIDLTHAFKQHGLHYHMTDYYTNSGARKGRSVKSHEEAMKRIHKKVSDDHGPKVAEDMHKHSQSMANSWYRGDDAPKSAAALRAKHKVKWDGDIDKVDDKPDPKLHKEEVDNETFTKEVETNKKKNTGELRNEKGVAAAATQSVAVQKEEIEQVEEEVEHVLGYIGPITEADLNNENGKRYYRNELIGKAGMEYQYDKLLRGTPGVKTVIVNYKESATRESLNIEPISGIIWF